MKKMWVIVAIVISVAYLVVDTLRVAGSFKSITNSLSGNTEFVYKGIYGPEDMDIDEVQGKLYISSSDRWKLLSGSPSNDGIFVLDVDSSSTPRKLATTYTGEFHPHGISLLRNDTTLYLFAVNHNALGNFIEAFQVHQDTLVHLKSYDDKEMCCPNDVVAVSPEKFYVTNDHGKSKGFMRTVEEYGRLPLSSVKYFDGAKFTTVITGLQYGNGINVNADGTRIFVATTIGRNLITYERNKETGELKHLASLSLKTGLDNIDVDAEGNLWIAAHPKLLAFVGHAKDSAKDSPSQVLMLRSMPGDTYEVTEILMDDGQLLSGSSVAVRYKDWLFVGGVFEPRILRIRLGADPGK